MSRIVLEGASRVYGSGPQAVWALHATDLVIEAGEMVVVLGASGAGKTTLLNLVGGMDAPSAGTVRVGDVEVSGLSRHDLVRYRQRAVGMVFQFHNLVANLTARENVELVADLVGRGAAVDEALAAVGLADRGRHFPHELSGGEQQRVAIARALVKDPPLVLGDEPTGNLDAATGKQIVRLFCDLHGAGRTVVLITHNAAIARVATRVIRMRDGRVVGDARNEGRLTVDEIDW